MYNAKHIIPPIRDDKEKETNHPVFKAFIESKYCRTFARDDVRERVIPAYMGLIKQIDDQLGILFSWMRRNGLFENTMIVFTSDHGDYLGDHWMGEKDLFHDQSVKVPLIIYDPRKEANKTRGTENNQLVESIDLAPTFLDYFSGKSKPQILEGRNLAPLLHNNSMNTDWRQYAISEYDYSTREARQIIGNDQNDARLIMIRDKRWKYIFAENFRPMFFDLQNDPNELHDLGESKSPEHVKEMQRFYDEIFAWARLHHSRTTITKEQIEKMTLEREPEGIVIGVWDEHEYKELFGRDFYKNRS